ncbi:hypothetical protein N5B92_00850 [Acinetobacter johnsonii]|uniref:hypothetical protein n=1 Tax=Acinetobacter johnsonii TaxID=40214 RepID=UPI00244B6566|nr:hypothetical protein [Acinetobacter johnsonii]MDH1276194.1 hypothetical protein [Acinetobacter johnsonii]
MARARNIKPSFFTNDELVELEPIYRLLFIGLWVLADREGRLENRPKKIKMELFPADNVDIESGLSALQKTGFISLYNCYETNVIQINNFAKHQAPHGLEKDSDLPNEDGTYTTYKRNQNKTINGDAVFISREQWLESKGLTEKKRNDFRQLTSETTENGSETVLEHDKNALNPDSLNPESLNLNDESNTDSSIKSASPKFTFKTALKKSGVSEEQATEFMVVRKAKKAVNTKNAFDNLVSEAEKANLTPAQAVDYCLKRQNPWGAFKASWFFNEQQNHQVNNPIHGYQTSQQRTTSEMDRWRQAEQQAFGERDVTPKKSALIEEVGHA